MKKTKRTKTTKRVSIKRISTIKAIFLLPIFLITLPLTIVSSMAAGVDVNGTGYINFKKYCVQGANYYSETTTAHPYIYRKYDGNNTYMRMMYLSDTNTGVPRTDAYGNPVWAYCIEYGQEVNSTYERTADDPNNIKEWQDLGAERQQGIALAALYGSSLNVPKADMYAAIQAVIWEFQTGVRTSVTDNTRNAVTYKNVSIESDRFERIFYHTNGIENSGKIAYDTLIQRIYSHFTTCNFGIPKTILKFDIPSKTYKSTLIDYNNILSEFDVAPLNPELKVEKDGNVLTLSSKTALPDTQIVLTKHMPQTTAQPLLVLKPGAPGQITIVGQSPVPVKVALPVSVEPLVIPTYKIGVLKDGEVLTHFQETTDSSSNLTYNSPKYQNQHLENCQVKIYAAEDIVSIDGILRNRAGDLVDTLVTNKDNIVYSKELYEGNYIVKEVIPPKGYAKSQDSISVSLQNGNQVVTLNDERIRPKFNFKKVFDDLEGESYKDIEKEVLFGVYTTGPIGSLPQDSLVGLIHPNKDGTCNLESDLPFGHLYYLKELKTLPGYVLDNNEYDLETLNNQELINFRVPIEIPEKTPESPAPPPEKPQIFKKPEPKPIPLLVVPPQYTPKPPKPLIEILEATPTVALTEDTNITILRLTYLLLCLTGTLILFTKKKNPPLY